MANTHSLFQSYNSNIRLNKTNRNLLVKGKKALKTKIKNHFEDTGMTKPKLRGQGSFSMDTILNQLPDKDYDVDYGVYIQSYSDVSQDDWPTTSTVHKWIKDAVDGHTSTPPVDKNTCVRVIYKDDYHIDLPAYILKDDIAYLAHKANGWIESDPKSFTEWFEEKVKDNGAQLRRVVRYLKGWKDYQNRTQKTVDMSGLAITILVAENFYASTDRDDKSLLGTLTSIIDRLESNFRCDKPVIPNENLFEGYTSTKADGIIDNLKKLQNAIEKALGKDCELEASKELIKKLGDRFPEGKKLEQDDKKSNNRHDHAVKTPRPAVIHDDGRSA